MNKKRGAIALGEILILVLAIVSFSYIVGSEINIVSAATYQPYSNGEPIGEQFESGNRQQALIEAKSMTNSLADDVQLVSRQDKIGIGGVVSTVGSGAAAVGDLKEKVTSSPKPTPKLENTISGLTFPLNIGGREVTDLTPVYREGTKEIYAYSGTLKDSGRIETFQLSELRENGVFLDGDDKVIGKESPKGNFLWGKEGFWGIVQDTAWAGAVYGLTQVIGNAVSDNDAGVDAASFALSGGFLAGRFSYKLLSKYASPEGFFGQHAAGLGVATGAAVGIGISLLMYKKESTEIVSFECNPWDAPVGGDDCEKCNSQDLPCSEYQCRSLGQACELVNSEAEGTSLCVNTHRGDVNPPIITPWEEALTIDFRYTPNNAVSPPDRGVNIIYQNNQQGCIPAFTPLTFGINTDEPARCKVDFVRRQNLEEMRFFLGGSSIFSYNHTQVLNLPGPNATGEGGITLNNGNEMDLYVKCVDAMGNENEGDFLFSFCVDSGPDTTPPLIVTTNLVNGMPVSFGTTELEVELYTNEPASCKWSRRDQSFQEMEKTMSCSRSVFEMNAQMLYKCVGTLDGIQDRVKNDYYFRREDKPLAAESDRNVNRESYLFSVQGTQELFIDSVEPNGTIKGNSNVVEVKLEVDTRAGYNDGQAQCYVSDSEDESSYILFDDTDNTNGKSTQQLFLPSGSYQYYIRCIDLGGNSDNAVVNFNVETDNSPPLVVRAYKEQNYLKIITSEENSACVYDTNNCAYSFEDGIKPQTEVNGEEHFVDWDSEKTYYVKCEDEFSNRPAGNACSIIVRPVKSGE